MGKVIKQHDEKDCGAACTAMVAKKFGISMPLIKIRELLKTDNDGTSVYAMTKAAKELGLIAKAFECDNLDELEKTIENQDVLLPLVAHIITETNELHFIVIDKISKRYVYVSDPAEGRRKIPRNLFCEQWTGIIIEYRENGKKAVVNYKSETYNIIKKIISANKKNICVIGMLSIFISLCELLNVLLIQKIVDLVVELFIPSIGKETHVHSFMVVGEKSVVVKIIEVINSWLNDYHHIFILLFVVCVLLFGSRCIRGKKYADFSMNFDYILITRLFNKALHLPTTFYESRRVGEIVSRFSDTSKIRDSMMGIIMTLCNDIVIVLILGLTLFFTSKQFFLIIIGLAIIYFLFFSLQKAPLNNLMNRLMINNEKLVSYITNIFSTIVTVKAHNKEYFLNDLKGKLENFINSIKQGMFFSSVVDGINNLISDIANLILLLIGMILCASNKMSVSELISSFVIFGYLLEPINNIASVQTNFQNIIVGVERLDDVLLATIEKDIQEIDNITVYSNIEFKNVCFNYGYRETGVKDISFNIEQGEKVAIVGETGSGKSTIAKLLLKYYDVSAGTIKIGGKDINNISNSDIKRKMVYLSQEINIFNESIRNNILMGRENISEEAFEEICQITLVDEVVSNRPCKYETVIDEKGYDLSKGEKQRIALARVLIGNPDIIVLDEMASNLDIVTERRILNNIKKKYSDKIIIYIAHRLSTISDCDNIIVINRGRIVEQGKHDELFNKRQTYYNMWISQ